MFLLVLNCIHVTIEIYIQKTFCIAVSLDPELSVIVGQFCRNLCRHQILILEEATRTYHPDNF